MELFYMKVVNSVIQCNTPTLYSITNSVVDIFFVHAFIFLTQHRKCAVIKPFFFLVFPRRFLFFWAVCVAYILYEMIVAINKNEL